LRGLAPDGGIGVLQHVFRIAAVGQQAQANAEEFGGGGVVQALEGLRIAAATRASRCSRPRRSIGPARPSAVSNWPGATFAGSRMPCSLVRPPPMLRPRRGRARGTMHRTADRLTRQIRALRPGGCTQSAMRASTVAAGCFIHA
jgi:hypothetical protein